MRPRMSRIFWNGKYLDYPLKGTDVIRKLGPIELRARGLSYLWAAGQAQGPRGQLRAVGLQPLRQAALQPLLQVLHREGVGRPDDRDPRRVGRPAHQGPVVLQRREGRVLRQQGQQDQVADRQVPVPALRPGPDVGEDDRPASRRWAARSGCRRRSTGSSSTATRVRAIHAGGEVIEPARGRLVAAAARHRPRSPTRPRRTRSARPARACATATSSRSRSCSTARTSSPTTGSTSTRRASASAASRTTARGARGWSRTRTPPASAWSTSASAGDDLWTMSDDDLVALATQRARAARPRDARARCAAATSSASRSRTRCTTPSTPSASRRSATGSTRSQGLVQVGRNGLHRYNNSDHSMLSAMRAVDNLLAGAGHDIWAVNVESAYHEEETDADAQQPYKKVPHDARPRGRAEAAARAGALRSRLGVRAASALGRGSARARLPAARSAG